MNPFSIRSQIQHKGKFKKQEILRKFFEIVSDSEFFPVSYTVSKNEDYFLIRLCRVAISKLFASRLCLHFRNETVPLTVKFQVAQFKLGQIYPSKKMLRACTERFQSLITCEGVSKVLNLDNFAASPEFENIVVNLANKQSLQLLCTTLEHNQEVLADINGIRLSNNNIYTLDSFTKLPNLNLQLIDLRNNDVSICAKCNA